MRAISCATNASFGGKAFPASNQHRRNRLRLCSGALVRERLPLPSLAARQLDAGDLRVARNDRVSGPQDEFRRAPVFRHGDALDALHAKGLEEVVECTRSCAAEAIDCLVGIAHGKHAGLLTRQQASQFNLRDVGILELVDQHKARASSRTFQVGGCSAGRAVSRWRE